MTNLEIEESNKQIESHNKFCFMKKKIPLYKPNVPISKPITLMIISAILIALPSFFQVTTTVTWADNTHVSSSFSSNNK